MTSKYSALYRHLCDLVDDQWRASFDEIEAVLGFPLPRSARTYHAWWCNQGAGGRHSHAQAWQNAGWRTRRIDVKGERVTFMRVGPVEAPADKRPMTRTAGAPGKVQANTGGGLPVHKVRPAKMLSEQLTRWVMSEIYDVPLSRGVPAGIDKSFTMVSADGMLVGDTVYLDIAGRTRSPSAVFSTIAGHVWQLEKAAVDRRFLVFGNDRRVPVRWLERYGDLVSDVRFYFLSDDGRLETLRGSP